MLDWTDDPDCAGPPDAPASNPVHHSEPSRVVEVASGARPFALSDFTDSRCRAVAAVCAALLEFPGQVRPRPTLVVQTLQRLGLAGPGCRAWVLRMLHDEPIRRSSR